MSEAMLSRLGLTPERVRELTSEMRPQPRSPRRDTRYINDADLENKVLLSIARHSRIQAGELAAEMGISPTRLSWACKRLIELGYPIRELIGTNYYVYYAWGKATEGEQ